MNSQSLQSEQNLLILQHFYSEIYHYVMLIGNMISDFLPAFTSVLLTFAFHVLKKVEKCRIQISISENKCFFNLLRELCFEPFSDYSLKIDFPFYINMNYYFLSLTVALKGQSTLLCLSSHGLWQIKFHTEHQRFITINCLFLWNFRRPLKKRYKKQTFWRHKKSKGETQAFLSVSFVGGQKAEN